MAGVIIQGIDEAIAELEAAGGEQGLRAGMEAAALYLKGKVATYPAQRRAPQPFKTDRQRRAFFAKLRSGQIDVPYRRGQSAGSQRLGQSWTVEIGPGARSAIIGNDATYGPLVMQRGTQAAYHQGNWKTVEDYAEQEVGAVVRILTFAKGLG